jgi:hypothetical protein
MVGSQWSSVTLSVPGAKGTGVSRPGIGVLERFLMAGVTLHRSAFNKNGSGYGKCSCFEPLAGFPWRTDRLDSPDQARGNEK